MITGKIYNIESLNNIPLYHVSNKPDEMIIGSKFDCKIDWINRGQLSFFLEAPIAEFVENIDYIARYNTEHYFEETRRNSFSNLPSRKYSLFISENIILAKKWVKNNRTSIFEIYPDKNSKIIFLDYCWYNYVIRLFKNPQEKLHFKNTIEDEIKECTENYWSGKLLKDYGFDSGVEGLIEGCFTIGQKIII